MSVRGCSSSANPARVGTGAIEAGLRTLLPRAFAGSKGGSERTDPRRFRPPAFPSIRER
jgi:hypothetical protein